MAWMGGLSQIEQFARQETDGWDVWGNAVDSSITLLRINSSASQKGKMSKYEGFRY